MLVFINHFPKPIIPPGYLGALFQRTGALEHIEKTGRDGDYGFVGSPSQGALAPAVIL